MAVMMKIMTYVLICSALLSGCNELKEGSSEFITVGTFNIQWLGDGHDDNVSRSDGDYAEIADIISSSGMDIIAVQEVENEAAVNKIIANLEGYKACMSNKSGKQNVGIIYKDHINITSTHDYMPLTMNGRSRPGYVVSASVGKNQFDIMVVHLKSTSRYDSTDELRLASREMRAAQAELISNWADSMMSIEKRNELVIMGDFNDYPARKNNATLTPIIYNPNLVFLTAEVKSCKQSNLYAIDHIVVSTTTCKRFVQGSVFVYDFNVSLPDTDAEKVSDHCPISVQLKLNK